MGNFLYKLAGLLQTAAGITLIAYLAVICLVFN